MYIKEFYDFNDLKNKCWSNAIDTLQVVEDNDKESELMSLIKEDFNYDYDIDIPTLTEVNDFLRFEWEYIFNRLEIEEDKNE